MHSIEKFVHSISNLMLEPFIAISQGIIEDSSSWIYRQETRKLCSNIKKGKFLCYNSERFEVTITVFKTLPLVHHMRTPGEGPSIYTMV